MSNFIGILKPLLSGSVGGVCIVLVGHPFDTIKVLLQTMPQPRPGEPPLYKGAIDCAKQTIRREGITGLYKGMTPPLVCMVPMFAMRFGGFSLGKRILATNQQSQLTHPQLFGAGALAGIFASIVTAPAERLKCLLQTQTKGEAQKYHGTMDAAVKVYKQGGLPNLYRGLFATLLRDIPGLACWFFVYEYLQKLNRENSPTGKTSLLSTILAGGTAGVAYWVVALPPDVLKSRIQSSTETTKQSIMSVFKEILARDGPKGLYRGLSPAMMRAFPANAASFLGVEITNILFAKVVPGW